MDRFISKENLHSDSTDLRQVQVGQTAIVYGMVHGVRLTKWGGFIIIRKAEGLLQTVVQKDKIEVLDEKDQPMDLSDLGREMAVRVEGKVNEAHIKDNFVIYKNIEIEVASIRVLSRPAVTNVIDVTSLKFGDEESLLRFKFDNRQVTLRNPRDMAIIRVASIISRTFAEYLSSQHFTQIFTPKIVSEGAEGGANIFKLDYFDKQAFLAQSPQFYKQIGVGIFERVFEVAPVYRAEKHNTSRHLNEYISLDLEMGFIKGQEDVMEVELNFLAALIDKLGTDCQYELNLFGAELPKLPSQVPAWKLSEVHEILWDNHILPTDHRGEDDLAPEEEKAICKYALEKYDSDFVFVTHFPSAHRAFYAMDDPDDPTLTLSFDLLMRGLEITSGGQRMHEAWDYERKMRLRGMNPDNFHFYLDTFKNGMPPHGGCAIGLERIAACFLNLSNVKEASMFPRDINRIAP